MQGRLMKLTLLLAVLLTGCATQDGTRFIPIIDPVPGYQGKSAWAPMAMPGQTTYVVNGNAFVVYKSR